MSIPLINGHVLAASNRGTSAFDPSPRAMPTITAAPIGSADVQAREYTTGRDTVDAVKTLNNFVEKAAPGIQFSVDESTGKTVVKIIDIETKTLLRQIPSAEALSIAKSLDKLQGLLIRERA